MNASRSITRLARRYRALRFPIAAVLLAWLLPPAVASAQVAAPSPPAASGPGATLRISTTKRVPLHKDIHSASTADIFYTKDPLAARDILADPFFSQVKALNLQSLGFVQDASAIFHHVVVGDTRIHGGQGDGYNYRVEEFTARGKDVRSAFDGTGAHRFGKDFFNEYCAMREKLGIPGAVTANVMTGTIEEALWEIERAHATRVVFSLELVTSNHRADFPTAQTYVAKVSPWVKEVKKRFPDVITVLDSAWDDKPAHHEWNRQLQRMPGDQVRMYLWDRDLYNPVQAKEPTARIAECFAKSVPEMVGRLHRAFPDKKISVLQWGLKPGGSEYNTLFGSLHVARMMQWMILFNRDNANLIDYASFTNLFNLLLAKPGVTCHYHALRLCGQLFQGTPDVLEATVAGASGVEVVCCEESGRRTLLAVNTNNKEVAIPSVLIDGAPAPGASFHITAIWGTDPKSSRIAHEDGDSQSLALKPYSVNLIRF